MVVQLRQPCNNNSKMSIAGQDAGQTIQPLWIISYRLLLLLRHWWPFIFDDLIRSVSISLHIYSHTDFFDKKKTGFFFFFFFSFSFVDPIRAVYNLSLYLGSLRKVLWYVVGLVYPPPHPFWFSPVLYLVSLQFVSHGCWGQLMPGRISGSDCNTPLMGFFPTERWKLFFCFSLLIQSRDWRWHKREIAKFWWM